MSYLHNHPKWDVMEIFVWLTPLILSHNKMHSNTGTRKGRAMIHLASSMFEPSF